MKNDNFEQRYEEQKEEYDRGFNHGLEAGYGIGYGDGLEQGYKLALEKLGIILDREGRPQRKQKAPKRDIFRDFINSLDGGK